MLAPDARIYLDNSGGVDDCIGAIERVVVAVGDAQVTREELQLARLALRELDQMRSLLGIVLRKHHRQKEVVSTQIQHT